MSIFDFGFFLVSFLFLFVCTLEFVKLFKLSSSSKQKNNYTNVVDLESYLACKEYSIDYRKVEGNSLAMAAIKLKWQDEYNERRSA